MLIEELYQTLVVTPVNLIQEETLRYNFTIP